MAQSGGLILNAASQFSAEQAQAQFASVEIEAPSLVNEDINIQDVLDGRIYMVNEPNPQDPARIVKDPNQDMKVSAFLSEKYQVVVVSGIKTADTGLYVKTILPIKDGWIKEKYIKTQLIEVTPETVESLVTLEQDTIRGGCAQCLANSQVTKSLAIQIRKHPVYIMAGLILLHFIAECVIFADLITDVRVAITLAQNNKDWLFMLTSVFILAPYYIAWAAAFGYLQKRAMDSTAASVAANKLKHAEEMKSSGGEDFRVNTLTTVKSGKALDEEKNNEAELDEDEQDAAAPRGAPDRWLQIFVLMFSVAPIGVCFLVMLDLYLFFEDLFIKPIYLCIQKDLLREESLAESGYKKLRRVSEVVAETICQSVLQLGIYLRYVNDDNTDIDKTVVLSSLVTSILVLVIWGAVLKFEANSFGLHFYEYVTVVLQGSFNFVPYLPAIERGKRDGVNWTNFRFDSHSVGLVSKALISPECKLQQIKLSKYSLQKLTSHECRFLGQMLADSPKQSVQVVFSRSRREVEELFHKFDTDNSRTFDYKEFLQLCAALRQSDDGSISALEVANIFKDIADLRTKEVYLTDLLLKIGNSLDRVPVVDYTAPVMYALKSSEDCPNLLTFMLASKVCDEAAWDYYTTTLVTKGNHKEALVMCEERGVPMVVEIMSGRDLQGHDANGLSDPYLSVSVAGQVKRTETKFKTLTPIWDQYLLFTIPFDQIPRSLSDGNSAARAFGASGGAGVPRRRGSKISGGGRLSEDHGRRDSMQRRGSKIGTGGGSYNRDLNRLEVNVKVYDYDDDEDDDFMGSYKHFIKLTEQALLEHQGEDATQIDPDLPPTVMDKELRDKQEKVGYIKLRFYVATLRYYMKYRNFTESASCSRAKGSGAKGSGAKGSRGRNHGGMSSIYTTDMGGDDHTIDMS